MADDAGALPEAGDPSSMEPVDDSGFDPEGQMDAPAFDPASNDAAFDAGGDDAGFGDDPPGSDGFAGGYEQDYIQPDSTPSDMFGAPIQRRPSVRFEEKAVITRLHMLEFISEKEWWYEGQNQLCFTLALWVIFMFIMYTRSGINESYNLHLSVVDHMENIVAHPLLSGIRVRAVEDDPLPCKCACQASSAGLPKGPCDSKASEIIDFLGLPPKNMSYKRLAPAMYVAALMDKSVGIVPSDLGDKLGAGNDDIESVTWDTIQQPHHVWFWIEHGFLPDVWRPRSQQAGNGTLQGLVAQKNLIIGGVRARQTRSAWSATCDGKVSSDFSDFYRTDCRSKEAATGSYGPMAMNTTNTTRNSIHAFQPSVAKEQDGYYDALFDVELNISSSLETATLCRKYNWIDGATRTVNLQSVALNAEVGMFAIIDIEFKFPAGGGVEKKVGVHTIHTTGSKQSFSDIIPELMWAGMIILLIRQEIWQMCSAGCGEAGFKSGCMDYWLDLWCVVDWISIFVAILIAIFWMLQMSSIGTISEDVAALPRSPFLNGPPADIFMYRTQWQKILDDCITVFGRKQYYQLSLFWYTLILTGRFLKGFLSQAKLAMLQLTVGTVTWDLYHLLIFFGMLFLNFQLGGHILFGPELEEWSSMVEAGATSVRMLLGSYQFDPMFEIAPVSATMWFWCFLFSMVFVLMNLIFAMIADYFHSIRESLGETDTLWRDSVNAITDFWWRLQWRKIQFDDSEYKTAFIEGAYTDVVSGLMEACEVPASMERGANHTCIGVRLGRRHMEALSVEAPVAWSSEVPDGNKGFNNMTSKEIQGLGTEMMAADHLMELAMTHVITETDHKNKSELSMVRHFVALLREHHREMDKHCYNLEGEVTMDHEDLIKCVSYLEQNVRVCLDELKKLKAVGVHSLAPPMQALPRPGTLAAKEAQQSSMVAPGALLRAIDIHQKINAQAPGRGPPVPPMLSLDPHNQKEGSIASAALMDAPVSNQALLSLGHNSSLSALGRPVPALAGMGDLPARALTNAPANAPMAQQFSNAQPQGEMLQLADNSNGGQPPAGARMLQLGDLEGM